MFFAARFWVLPQVSGKVNTNNWNSKFVSGLSSRYLVGHFRNLIIYCSIVCAGLHFKIAHVILVLDYEIGIAKGIQLQDKRIGSAYLGTY